MEGSSGYPFYLLSGEEDTLPVHVNSRQEARLFPLAPSSVVCFSAGALIFPHLLLEVPRKRRQGLLKLLL